MAFLCHKEKYELKIDVSFFSENSKKKKIDFSYHGNKVRNGHSKCSSNYYTEFLVSSRTTRKFYLK